MEEDRAREDLAMIRRLMEEGRREVVDRGKHFMVWGVIPALGAAATYGYASGMELPDPVWIWGVLLVVGWVASLAIGRRESREARVGTPARRLLGGVWISAAVTLTALGVSGMVGDVLDYRAMPGVLSVVIAAPVLVTMQLTGERWLGVVGAGWLVGGLVMLFVPGVYSVLLMGVMSLLLLAVPGWVLNRKANARAGAAGGEAAIDSL